MSSPNDRDHIKVIQDYFRLADQGRPEVLDLFREDADIYFPKVWIRPWSSVAL
jgi:hypothetical protein